MPQASMTWRLAASDSPSSSVTRHESHRLSGLLAMIIGFQGIEFFVSGDQLLRGAALNAVIIAESAVKARA